MARFIKIPTLEIGRKGQWILADRLIYSSSLIDDLVIVEKGFETDLASIPRVFTPLIPKNGKHRAAAIVHDYLCREKPVTRGVADKIFLEAMKVLKVRAWRRNAMYFAVRTASGWS